MMPVSLLIQRKTKVPTKHQIAHMYRSDWKKVGKINYEDSKRLFKNIENVGIIETDAQFCNWLLDNFGVGTYFISAWRKGHKGFWSFMKVEIKEEGFRRLPKNVSKDELEKKQEIQEQKELKKRLATADKDEVVEIKEDLETSDEVVKIIEEDMQESKKTKRGCYPYLKSIQPVYSFHSYEDYGEESKEEEFSGRMV